MERNSRKKRPRIMKRRKGKNREELEGKYR
jgi:hypothetical protein